VAGGASVAEEAAGAIALKFTALVFVAGDGTTAEVTLAEVRARTNCIVSFRKQGGFSTLLPDFPGRLQLHGVVEIQVK
jgi:hypothetical protein